MKSCDNCYYEYFDEKAYPCSLCIRGIKRTDKWMPSKKTKDETQKTEEVVSCQACKHWIPYECTNDKCHYEPKAEELYDQIVEDINTRVKCAFAKKVEDEPQTERNIK